MHYIAMVFHAPLQSWGSVNMPDMNRASGRRTYNHPTLSGILGIVRSALGEKRDEDSILNPEEFRLITRRDREGKLSRDYNVAQRSHHGFRAGANKEIPKFFLEDTTFTVMLGHTDAQLINRIASAMENPTWAPFLGRRAHVPHLPILLGKITINDPIRYLTEELPLLEGKTYKAVKKIVITDTTISDPDGQLQTTQDFPLSFNPKDKQYSLRTSQILTYEIESKGNYSTLAENYEEILEKVSSYANN